MALDTPEIVLPANFATRFTGMKTRRILDHLERCRVIAAVRASTRGSRDMIASVMSSGNTAGGSDSETGTKERWVAGGDDVYDCEPRERLRSSFSSATGLSCCGPGRPRVLRMDPAGVRDNRA
jgi:hypothetical protein